MANNEYDPSKDKLVRDIGDVELDEKVRINVSLRSYNGDEPKIAILKVGDRRNGEKWFSSNLGRLPKDVAAEVARLVLLATDGHFNNPAPGNRLR